MPSFEEAPVFQISKLNSWGSRILARHRAGIVRFGEFETELLSSKIDRVDTSRPIFVTGLARSGTTILLELLAAHSAVASQRYLDYPFIFTPYLWNRFIRYGRGSGGALAERAHRDGLLVSAESPEAMEEPIWMHFFPECHNPNLSNILDSHITNLDLEKFYDAHMAKLLLARRKSRYLCKGNYHLARIAYLLTLYPEARFVIPVRDPGEQVASSIRQHRLFTTGQQQSPAARLYLSQVGHFEFGLDRKPINVDIGRTRQILDLWSAGDELGGWALYWAAIHDYLLELIESSQTIRKRVLIVPYEGFCAESTRFADRICDFCALTEDPAVVEFAKQRVKPRVNNEPGLSVTDIDRVDQITGAVRQRIRRFEIE